MVYCNTVLGQSQSSQNQGSCQNCPVLYICMGLAVCSAARVEGVVAEVVWRVFECDEGAGTHLAVSLRERVSQPWRARTLFLLRVHEYRRCNNGRSVRLGVIHACMCPPKSAPTMRHE